MTNTDISEHDVAIEAEDLDTDDAYPVTLIEGEQATATVMLPEEEIDETTREQITEMVNHPAFSGDISVMSDAHAGAGCVVGFTMPLTAPAHEARIVPNVIGSDVGCGVHAQSLGSQYADLPVIDDDLDAMVRERVPFGFAVHDRVAEGDTEAALDYIDAAYPWETANTRLFAFERQWGALNGAARRAASSPGGHDPDYDRRYVESLITRAGLDPVRFANSFGTLGSGNHFIEFSEGEESAAGWLVIHSGSRKLGQTIAQHHQERATELRTQEKRGRLDPLVMDALPPALKDALLETDTAIDMFRHPLGRGIATEETGRNKRYPNGADVGMDVPAAEDFIREQFDGPVIANLIADVKAVARERRARTQPDRNTDLDWLEGVEADSYLVDMIFAQVFAETNRAMMARAIHDGLVTASDVAPANAKPMPTSIDRVDELHTDGRTIDCAHNYIDFRDLTIRKGAIRAHHADPTLVPLNMGEGTLLGRGRGADLWNRSAPHGAGRQMGRREATRELSLDEMKANMESAAVFSTALNDDTLEEAPAAYKDSALIRNALVATMDVTTTLRPVHNLKADGRNAPDWAN